MWPLCWLCSAALLVGSAAAQPFYLFKRIGKQPGSYDVLIGGLEVKDSTISVFGGTADFLGAGAGLITVTIALSGTELSRHIIAFDSTHLNAGWYSVRFAYGNRWVVSGSLTYYSGLPGSGLPDPFVAVLDAHGALQWMQVLERDSFNYFSQGKLSHDGQFVFAGITCVDDCDMLFIKTDTLGNVLWERTLGTFKYDAATSLCLAPDGGYYLVGSSDYYGGWPGVYIDGMLVKTDSLGHELWRRTWGGPSGDGTWNVMPTADSGVVICGNVSVDDNDRRRIGHLRKYDRNGNLLWNRVFDDTAGLRNNNLVMCRELPDGSLVAAGQCYTKNITAPYLAILSAEGELLHRRAYTSFLNLNVTPQQAPPNAWFQDVNPTPDGGFVVGGTMHPGAADTGNQDIFVLLLDSVGCEYPHCYDDTATAVPEAAAPLTALQAWPNPTTGLLEVAVTEGGGVLSVFDARGQQVLRRAVSGTTAQLDLSALAQGLYYLSWQGSAGVFTLKVHKL